MLDRLIERFYTPFHLAVIFTLVLLVAIIFITLRSGIQTYTHLGTTCLLLGCITFFIVDNRQKGHSFHREVTSIRTGTKVAIIAFCIIAIASTFSLLSENSYPFRPLSFFILFAILYGVIIYHIYRIYEYNPLCGKSQIYIILFEIIVASMILKMSCFSYSYFFQDDPGFHINFANNIASLGTIPPDLLGNNYESHPLFHIFYAMGIIVTCLGQYDFQGVTALIQTVSVLAVYLITVKITEKPLAGLLAALLYSIFGLSILYSVVTTTQGFSTLYVLLILFLYFKYTSGIQKPILLMSLIVIVSVALVFIHIQYSFVAILWLLIYAIILIFCGGNRSCTNGWQYLVISLFLIWFAKELYSVLGDRLLSTIRSLGSSVCDIFSNTASIGIVQGSGPVQEYWMYLLANIGVLFYYTFLTSGVLLLLNSKQMKSRIFAFWSLLIFVVMIVGMAMGQKAFLFSRYYYWVGLVLSILGGVVLYSIVARIQACNVRVTRSLLAFILVISLVGLCFVTITSERSNNLDPVLYERQTPFIFFHTYEETEILSRFFVKIPDDYIVLTDLRTSSRGSIPSQGGGDVLLFSSPFIEDNRDYNCLLTNSYSIEKGVLFVSNGSIVYGWKIDNNVLFVLDNNMNKIFSSGIITATVKE